MAAFIHGVETVVELLLLLKFFEKAKPVENQGRKTTGLLKKAGLPLFLDQQRRSAFVILTSIPLPFTRGLLMITKKKHSPKDVGKKATTTNTLSSTKFPIVGIIVSASELEALGYCSDSPAHIGQPFMILFFDTYYET